MVQSLCCDENPETQRSNNGKEEKTDVFEALCSDGNVSIQNSNHSKHEKLNGLPPVPAKMRNLMAYSDTYEASSICSDEYFTVEKTSSESSKSEKQCNRKSKRIKKVQNKKNRKTHVVRENSDELEQGSSKVKEKYS